MIPYSWARGGPGAPLICAHFQEEKVRRLEIQQGKNDHEIRRLQQRYNVAGFNAYGEHIHSVHLNQTFTGVYFAAQ